MNNDLEALLRAASYKTNLDDGTGVQSTAFGSSDSEGNNQDAATLALQVNELLNVAATLRTGASTRAVEPDSSSKDSSATGTVLKTAAMMTGVGPLVTGLIKLFGSDEPEPLPSLLKYSAPPSIALEAGLTRDRQYSGLRYSASGSPESLRSQPAIAAPGATVQVNIQALDSQSFLDRQDDIARAVREAMLHSNSLNDVVLEL